MDIAILGCGPAGLLTALAVEERGFNPVIYSIAKKSIMPGAQFLHEYIDGASQPEDHLSIDFRKKGTKEGYATKVYGSPDASCSWDDFPSGAVEAWSLAGAYDRLWARYGDQVIDVEITERLLDGIEQRFALAFSTVPAPVLCHDTSHKFNSAKVWIRQLTNSQPLEDNFIEYNGDPTKAYYRTSLINGFWSSEFGHPVPMAAPGLKPLDTDCSCRPAFHRLGRFGQWKKAVLVNHAYHEAEEALDAV